MFAYTFTYTFTYIFFLIIKSKLQFVTSIFARTHAIIVRMCAYMRIYMCFYIHSNVMYS